MRTFVIVLVLATAFAAQAQSRGPIAVAPGADMQCVSVPISIVPAPTIRGTDDGHGNVDLDIFVLSSSATPQVRVSRHGQRIDVSVTVPDGMMSCTMRARLTGIAPGTYDVHLVRGGDLAHTSITVR